MSVDTGARGRKKNLFFQKAPREATKRDPGKIPRARRFPEWKKEGEPGFKEAKQAVDFYECLAKACIPVYDKRGTDLVSGTSEALGRRGQTKESDNRRGYSRGL